MRRAFFLLLLWALAAPSAFALGGTFYYPTSAAAYAAANVGAGVVVPGCDPYGRTFGPNGVSGTAPYSSGFIAGSSYCSSYFYYSDTGSCVAPKPHLQPDGTCGENPPPGTGATQAQKDQAKQKARDKAKASGLDQAAQDAAAAAAENIMDQWISAGKSEADSLKAAEVGGYVKAIEDIYSRYASESASARTTCQQSGANSSACNAAWNTYNQHMITAGVDPSRPLTLTLDGDGGKKYSYEMTHNGWDVFEVNTEKRTSKYLGTQPSLSFAPSNTTAISPGSVSPTADQAASGQPMRDPTMPPREVLDRAANPVPVYDPAARSITYHNPTTGDFVGRVTKMADGSITTSGSPPSGAENQLQRAIYQSDLSPAWNQAAPGSTGTSDNPTKTDVGQDTMTDGTASQRDAAYSQWDQRTNQIKDSAAPDTGWSLSFSSVLTNPATCTPWTFNVAGKSTVMDPCPTVDKLRSIFEFAAWFFTALGLWSILMKKSEE